MSFAGNNPAPLRSDPRAANMAPGMRPHSPRPRLVPSRRLREDGLLARLRAAVTQSGVGRCLGVVAVNLLAVALAFLLEPQFSSTPFVLFLAAVMYSSWYGGWLAGLAAVAFGGWTSNYLLLSHASPEFGDQTAVLRLVLFVLVALLVNWVNGARAAQQRAELSRTVAEGLQRWLQEILDLMPTPLLLLEPGTGRVTLMNQAAQQLEGGPADAAQATEWVRQTGIRTGDSRAPSASGTPCERAARGERVRGAQVDWGSGADHRSLLVNAALLPAMHGQPATILLPFQDITELKRSEEALRRSEERARGAERQLRHQLDLTRALTDSLGEGVLAMDSTGCVFMANPAAAELLRLPLEKLLGADGTAFLLDPAPDGSCPAAVDDSLQAAVRAGASLRSDDAVCRRLDGTSFPVAYTLSPVETAGTAIGSVLAFRDITERKREEEALRRLAEERASLVSTVSHALRAPIAAMLVNLEVLATPTLGALNPEQREYAERAAKSCEGLGEIVDRLLTISRLQAGRVAVRFNPVNLEELIREVHAHMAPRARSRGIELAIELPAGIGELTTDRRQLADILTELLENAIKYGRKGGRVSLVATASSAGVRVTVVDDGPGIAPEELEHLFNAFYRGEAARHEQVPGAGLGLSIVRQTAGLLGFEIDAANAPGGGACFSLTLPRAAGAHGAANENGERDDPRRRGPARDPGAHPPHPGSHRLRGGDGHRRGAGAGTVRGV